MGPDAPESKRRIQAGRENAAAGLRSHAVMSVKAWYLCVLVLSALITLLMGVLGEAGFFVLFGVIALYLFRRYRHVRKVRAAGLPGAEAGERPEKGGMPLAAIAVASILLAGSAASFHTTSSAINAPVDGICDYDHRPASALYQQTGRNGSVLRTLEFCDEHIGYFLVLHPLQSDGLASEGPEITFIGLSLGWWAVIFAGLWVLFISLMVLASVNIATTWDPVFVVCSMTRGILAMITGFIATILFMAAAVGLMVGFSDPASYSGLAGLLGATADGPASLLRDDVRHHRIPGGILPAAGRSGLTAF